MGADGALRLLHALVVDDAGTRWGERAVAVQRRDAEALVDVRRWKPRRHWVSRSRGYAKTDDLGAVTLAVLLEQLRPGDEAIGVAADRDQARILVDRIRWLAARTPELRNAVEVGAYTVTTRAGVRFEAIAADAPSSWGRTPGWAVADELCVWSETPGAKQLWDSVSTAVVKARGRLAVITTSGSPDHWSRAVYEHAVADRSWRVSETHGPAPWIDAEELASERRRLPESVYARLFENQWTSTEDRLLAYEDVLACAVLPGPLDPERGLSYVIGVDLALRNDRAAVAVCHGEQLGAEHGGGLRVVCDRLDIFIPTRGREIDLSAVEALVEARARTFNGAQVVFDPAQAWQMMQRLRRAGLRIVEHTFSASANSKRALALLELVRGRRLAIPDDRDLIEELASLRLVERGPGLYRYDHVAGKHDDAATALSLCAVTLLARPTGTPLRSFSPVRVAARVPTAIDRRHRTTGRDPLDSLARAAGLAVYDPGANATPGSYAERILAQRRSRR